MEMDSLLTRFNNYLARFLNEHHFEFSRKAKSAQTRQWIFAVVCEGRDTDWAGSTADYLHTRLIERYGRECVHGKSAANPIANGLEPNFSDCNYFWRPGPNPDSE